MGWPQFSVLALVVAALLFAPGYVVIRCLRLGRVTALCAAPAVSVLTIAGAAILAPRLGLRWGPLPVLVLTAVLALAAALLARLVGRGASEDGGAGRPAAVPAQDGARRRAVPARCWWAASVAGGIGLLVHNAIVIIGSTTSFSQTFDNLYHLNAVRWILDHGDGSSLTMAMTAGDGPARFYPLAWHDTVSLALMLMRSTVVTAGTGAMVVVVCSLVWGAGCFHLATRVAAPGPLAVVAIGFAVSAFPSFPYDPVGFGVLYPNTLGLALLPSAIALTIELLRLDHGPDAPVGRLLPALVLVVGGAALAHPNSFLTYCLVLVPTLAVWAVPLARRTRGTAGARRGRRALAVLGLAVLMAATAWRVLRPWMDQDAWDPVQNTGQALGEALALNPMKDHPAWVLAAAVLAGAVHVVRTRHGVWMLASHCCMIVFWMLISGCPKSPLRTALVGGWYSDPHRLASALPVTALPLAVVGLTTAGQWLARLLRTRERPLLEVVAAILSAALLMLTTQLTGAVRSSVGWSATRYTLGFGDLVDDEEYRLLGELHDDLPAGAGVATVPYNGSSMAYALEGVRTTTTHLYYTATLDVRTINEHLDEAASDPQVCRALEDLDVDYALDFGPREVSQTNFRVGYPGFDSLATSPGFEVVAREGHAVLYRITACA